MCGIVGYVGARKAIPILVGGLEKLEYRGYDSAGVATLAAEGFDVVRSEGKLSRLKDLLTERGVSLVDASANGAGMSLGIGHTRWATHGRPSETNAHPHVAGDVCVVHNGIIENYVELRARLQKAGYQFKSETDTEIAACLIAHHLKSEGDILKAVRKATAELEGSYALVVISRSNPDRIVVAKNATPVIVGLADDEMFVASDVPAVLEHTRRILILEDGEIAEVAVGHVHIEAGGKKIEREPITITWDPITAEKGGFRHFMLKEIHEQPEIISDTFRSRIKRQSGMVVLDDVNLSDEDLRAVDRVCLVACGSAWHASLVTKFYLERLAGIPVEVDYGSEYRYRNPLVDEKTMLVVVSQSGETADTLGSLNVAVEKGAKTLAICNVVGSSIARKAGNVFYTHAGPEISVASTKAFVAQLTAGYLLALRMGAARGKLTEDQVRNYLDDLVHVPAFVSHALSFNEQAEQIARTYGKARDFLYLGRGILYPIALEGALKLKEISYVHAEGYPAGELKHGPIALISEETPVVALLGHDGVNYDKAMSNIVEVQARGGKVIVITDRETEALTGLKADAIALGDVPPLMQPIVFSIPLQLLAYHIAVYRGTDVDQPRNLAKSVTVE